jgi:hypothetical protein
MATPFWGHSKAMTVTRHPHKENCWIDIDHPMRGEFWARADMTAEDVGREWSMAEAGDPAREARMEAEAKAAREAEADAEFIARAARLGYVKHSDLNGLIDARIAQRPSKN